MSKKRILNAIKAHNSEKQSQDPGWTRRVLAPKPDGVNDATWGDVGGTALDYLGNVIDTAVGAGQAVGGTVLAGAADIVSPLEDITDWMGITTPGFNATREASNQLLGGAKAGLYDAGSGFRRENWRVLNRQHTPDVTGHQEPPTAMRQWIEDTVPPSTGSDWLNPAATKGLANWGDDATHEAAKWLLGLKYARGLRIPGAARYSNWKGPTMLGVEGGFTGYDAYDHYQAAKEQAEAYDQMKNEAYRGTSGIYAKSLYGNLSQEQFDTLNKEQQVALLRQRRQVLMDNPVPSRSRPAITARGASEQRKEYQQKQLERERSNRQKAHDQHLNVYNTLLEDRGPENIEQLKAMSPEDQRFWLGLLDPTASPKEIAQFQQYGFNPEPEDLADLRARSADEIRFLLKKEPSWHPAPPPSPIPLRQREWQPPTEAEIDAEVDRIRASRTPLLPGPFGDGQDNPDVDLVPRGVGDQLRIAAGNLGRATAERPANAERFSDKPLSPGYPGILPVMAAGNQLRNLVSSGADEVGDFFRSFPSSQAEEELLPPVNRPLTDTDVPGLVDVAFTDPGEELLPPAVIDPEAEEYGAMADLNLDQQQKQEAPWYQSIVDWWGTLDNKQKLIVGGSLLGILGGPILGSQGHGMLGGAAALGGLGGLGYVASQNPMNFAMPSYPYGQPHAGTAIGR